MILSLYVEKAFDKIQFSFIYKNKEGDMFKGWCCSTLVILVLGRWKQED